MFHNTLEIPKFGEPPKYHFPYRGTNSRLDEIQAAWLRVKLPHLDADNARRAVIAARYCAEIVNPQIRLPALPARLPKPSPLGSRLAWLSHVFHVFSVFCDRRDDLHRFLAERGIQTVIHYPIPPHRQPAYAEWHCLSLSITERIHTTELSLPISPVMADEEVLRIIAAVNAFA